MALIWNVTFLISVLFIVNSVSSSPTPEEANDNEKDASDSSEGESSEKDLGTVSPTEMEKLKEEIIENQEENSEKFGLPLTSSPQEIESFLKEEEKEYGKELPEKIEEELTDTDDFKNFVHFLALFDKIETETSENEEEEEIKKSPDEMKEMKAEVFKLTNELKERQGLPEVSHEEFDTVWNKKKEEYGKRFPGKIEKLIVLLKETEEKEEPTTPLKEVSEAATEVSTHSGELPKEEPPKGAFVLRNAKGKICILAKFHSAITITYTGRTSDEQKVEVTIPPNSNIKGKCGGPNRSPSLQMSWGKFVFSLLFNKTSEDSWDVTLVELTYDTSEPLFDEAVDRGKVTAKSRKENLFETPFGKSYFCPAREVILYSENHVVTVRLKEVHLQPYDVEDGKFSTSHRCNQVVIGGLDEEPFVQDETIPLAVGCTLALITLLILVGFSVHRAYNAAKVDYNTME